MWGRCRVVIVFLPLPPHFDCFDRVDVGSLLFSFLVLLLLSIVLPRKGQRVQNKAITFKFVLIGLILASLRENNRKEEEEEKKEGKQ